jgi:hypothetical protein
MGLLALVAAAPAVRASLLPPIDGEVSGTFTDRALRGAPELRWRVTTRSAGSRRYVHAAVDGAGTRLRAMAETDADGNGEWRILDARLDAAVWYPPLGPAFGSGLAVAQAAGTIELRGGGALHAGRPAGNVQLVWPDGALRDSVAGWSFEGIRVEGTFAVDLATGTFSSLQPFALLVRTMSTTRFGARNLSVIGRLQPDRSVALEQARIEIAGGDVTLDPCVIALSPPALATRIRVNAVGLQDVAALVPAGLTETRGRVSGSVGFGWSDADGVSLGAGELKLDPQEPTVVRLAPAPGFLTSRVPERLSLLPGFAARWFRPANPAYAEVQAIELGRTSLRVRDLSIRLSPEGDARGRTASVRINGRPERADSIVKEVTFEVNVSGPLSEVLRMGMQQKFTVGVK